MIDLLKGDCMELMGEIQDGSVDMILCDLPYGTTHNPWDHVIPMEDHVVVGDKRYQLDDFLLYSYKDGSSYQEAMEYFSANKKAGLWTEYQRIIKDNGAIVLFASGMFTADLMHSNRKMWRYNLVWEKTCPTGYLNAKKMPLRVHEDILVFYKKSPVYNPQKTSGHTRKMTKAIYSTNRVRTSNYKDHGFTDYDSTERYPTSVCVFPKDTQKEAFHPTQKPVELLKYLIRSFTNKGDLVLDNCMGSGSTGVACIETGRKFIGMEQDENYFNIARERMNYVQLELE